jgi:hypothetical protein
MLSRMYQKILVVVIIAVVLVAGAVLVSELYLKPSPDTSTGPETPAGGFPSVIPTTAAGTSRTVPGSSEDAGSEHATSTGGTPSAIPTAAVGTSPAGTGSSQDTSADSGTSTGYSQSVIPATAIGTSPTVFGPPSFTLLVTPVEARARPGDTIHYTLSIVPKGGFDQPVSLRLEVSALFLYRNSFDLGTLNPPYPTTLEYSFTVPTDVPGGITVKATLTAEGGGHREAQDLILLVGN